MHQDYVNINVLHNASVHVYMKLKNLYQVLGLSNMRRHAGLDLLKISRISNNGTHVSKSVLNQSKVWKKKECMFAVDMNSNCLENLSPKYLQGT